MMISKTFENRWLVFHQQGADSHCRFLHAYNVTVDVTLDVDPDEDSTQLLTDDFIEQAVSKVVGESIPVDTPMTLNSPSKASLVYGSNALIPKLELYDQPKIMLKGNFSMELVAKAIHDALHSSVEEALPDEPIVTLPGVSVCVKERDNNQAGYTEILDEEDNWFYPKFSVTKSYTAQQGNTCCLLARSTSPDMCQIIPIGAIEVDVTFTAGELNQNNWVFNFGDPALKRFKVLLSELFDHRMYSLEYAVTLKSPMANSMQLTLIWDWEGPLSDFGLDSSSIDKLQLWRLWQLPFDRDADVRQHFLNNVSDILTKAFDMVLDLEGTTVGVTARAQGVK